MKLLAYTIGGQKIGIDIQTWNDVILSGNTAFLAIADTGSTPSNYTDISSIINWDNFGFSAGLTDAQLKQEITKLVTPTPTPEELIVLQKWGIYIDTSFISGSTGTFWGDFRVEGKLWVETIRRVKQEANIAYVRVDQALPVAGANGLAGLAILNPTGATTGYTSLDVIPAYYLGINKDGVLVAGWSGNTQPVAVGGAVVTNYNTSATGNITTTSTTDVLMTGMQLTNVPAGTYLLSFGTSLSISTTGNINTSIYAGGTIVANSTQPFARGTQAVTAQHGYSNFKITLASTQTVEIRWRTSTGTATANTNRYLTLIKVG